MQSLKAGWLLLVVLFVVGCTRTVYVPIVKSSSVIDTVIMTQADSATIRALFECDSTGRVLVKELSQTKGKMARQEIEFVDNELQVRTRWQTKYVDRLVEVRDTIRVVETLREDVAKPYVPKLFWICFLVVVVMIIWGVVKICRKIF